MLPEGGKAYFNMAFILRSVHFCLSVSLSVCLYVWLTGWLAGWRTGDWSIYVGCANQESGEDASAATATDAEKNADKGVDSKGGRGQKRGRAQAAAKRNSFSSMTPIKDLRVAVETMQAHNEGNDPLGPCLEQGMVLLRADAGGEAAVGPGAGAGVGVQSGEGDADLASLQSQSQSQSQELGRRKRKTNTEMGATAGAASTAPAAAAAGPSGRTRTASAPTAATKSRSPEVAGSEDHLHGRQTCHKVTAGAAAPGAAMAGSAAPPVADSIRRSTRGVVAAAAAHEVGKQPTVTSLGYKRAAQSLQPAQPTKPSHSSSSASSASGVSSNPVPHQQKRLTRRSEAVDEKDGGDGQEDEEVSTEAQSQGSPYKFTR